MEIEAYCDGSATTADKCGGFGYVIVIDGKKVAEGSGYMENASNNDAELQSAIEGLTYIKNNLNHLHLLTIEDCSLFPINISLISDSQIILGWANGTYAFRQQDKMEKFKELQYLVKSMNVQTKWIKGHSGNEHNERCDKLANAARLGKSLEESVTVAQSGTPTVIGKKKTGVMCFWYKNTLKIIDLDVNIVENYDSVVHGTRSSRMEFTDK